MNRHERTAWLPALTLPLLSLFLSSSLTAQEAGKWELLKTENGPTHRHESAYAKVGDRFYLVGGRGERPVEIFDPETGQWETGATPPLSMHHFQAVTYDDRIYVLAAFNGGFPDETPITHVHIYDPASDTWTQGKEIPPRYRRGAAGAVVYDGKIYLVGGIRNGHIDGHVRRLDAFDPETGQWESLEKAPRFRDHFHAAVVDDKLYAVGGRRTSQASGRVFELTIPEVDVYDFSTGEWEPLPPVSDLPTERAGTTALAVANRVVVIGGESAAQEAAHAEVEAFNPKSGQWQSLAPLKQGRHGMQAILHEGKIYVAAGSKTRGATEINSQEVYTLPDSRR